MQSFQQSFAHAWQLVVTGDATLLEIVLLSLRVSITATLIACILGLPLGALLATQRFRGKWLVTLVINTLMGMPPVVLGLIVYMLLSNAGPLGWLQMLYTPSAMILAQTVLILPIVAALSRQVIDDRWLDCRETFQSLCVPWHRSIFTMLRDCQISLFTVAAAGFARAISEVGAVIVVGGNINHLTRVMTTAIALETSKGDLALALALGAILMTIALLVNAVVLGTRQRLMA
jgi:tungstate transport system permease protein